MIDKINTDTLTHYYTNAIHIICSIDNGYISYMLDGSKVTISVNENDKIQFDSKGFTRNVSYYYDKEGNYLRYDNSTTMNSGTKILTEHTPQNYLYSSVEIYNSRGEKVNPYQPVLFQITQTEQILEIMKRTMKMIIPTGLVILSIGLLIYLIKSVISRVA